jgi:hypothetical protein
MLSGGRGRPVRGTNRSRQLESTSLAFVNLDPGLQIGGDPRLSDRTSSFDTTLENPSSLIHHSLQVLHMTKPFKIVMGLLLIPGAVRAQGAVSVLGLDKFFRQVIGLRDLSIPSRRTRVRYHPEQKEVQ